jgi:hypothetical protein
MRFRHRIAFRASPQDCRELASLGVHVDAREENMMVAVVELDEDDPRWNAVSRWVEHRRPPPGHMVTTVFSPEEIAAASWLVIRAQSHSLYPQPEDDLGYLNVTYDLSKYCGQCGIGAVQKAPFRLRAEPRWGRRGIMQLNWVFDEFFVGPAVAESVFERFGVATLPVLNAKGVELRTIRQLDLSREEVDIDARKLVPTTCAQCGCDKYAAWVRGYFPSMTCTPAGPVCRTAQHFGSGGQAFREVLISSDVAQALADARARGIKLRPVADGGDA